MKNIKLLNLNCRQASRLVSDGMDRQLTRMERVGLRLHLIICSACRAWRRQLLFIRRAIRQRPQADEQIDGRLSAEARQRIREALEIDS